MRGLELARAFYADAVQPILERRFPHVRHAAALIGTGSEVLGYDDDTSTDHHWGPRLQLFVDEPAATGEIDAMLAHELPTTFAGWSTNFGPPEESGSRLLVPVEHGPVAHRVEALVLDAYLHELIGINPARGFSFADWLVTPSQRLLEITAGGVFVDELGELTVVRELLAFYPHDVWLFVMAGHWRRVAQLEHLHGRAGSRGDELGARLIGASLVRDLMQLALLQARRYPPYPKWLGAAYAELDRPERAALEAAVEAGNWRERERHLATAYELLATAHNNLGVTAAVDAFTREFYDRGFRVLFADRVVEALRGAVTDPDVRSVEHLAGAVDAVSDNTDVLTRPYLWRSLVALYDRRGASEGSLSDGM